MLEKQIEQKLKNKILAIGGLALKFISPSFAGMPDRIVLLSGGRCVFVELKAPGKKLRALQVKRKQQLQALGFQVYCIDSLEKIERFIEEVKR